MEVYYENLSSNGRRAKNHCFNGDDDSIPSRRGLRSAPPPFLLKLYEMVEDPETNPIISWSSSKKTFIVWDTNNFASKLLLKYFRHNNFASFIYQLNNYGFKKTTWERFEYANPWFEKGKRDWLKNIKRRDAEKAEKGKEICVSSIQLMEEEMDRLKTENSNMELEIKEVRQRQGDLRSELAINKECIQLIQTQQEKMFSELVPVFIQQSVVQYLRDNDQEFTSDDEPAKKKRHVDSSISDEPVDGVEVTDQSVDSEKQIEEETTIMKREVTPLLGSSNDKDQKVNVSAGNHDDSEFWKKMMEDDLDC